MVSWSAGQDLHGFLFSYDVVNTHYRKMHTIKLFMSIILFACFKLIDQEYRNWFRYIS